MSLRTALLAASLVTASPATAQVDNTQSSSTAPSSSADTNNTAFTKEGKELWACAVKAVEDVETGGTKEIMETTLLDQKIYGRSERSPGAYYAANIGSFAAYDAKQDTVKFMSYVRKADDAIAGPSDAIFGIVMKFNKKTDVVDVVESLENADATSSKLVKTKAELAMVSFNECTFGIK